MKITITDASEPAVYYSFKQSPYDRYTITNYGHAYWNPNDNFNQEKSL
jgi:hypothetical protein